MKLCCQVVLRGIKKIIGWPIATYTKYYDITGGVIKLKLLLKISKFYPYIWSETTLEEGSTVTFLSTLRNPFYIISRWRLPVSQ